MFQSRFIAIFRRTVAATVSGVLSSFLFIGIGGRIAMELLAHIANRPIDFSIEGTFAMLAFSTSIGAVGGMFFPIVARYIPGSHATKGSGFGLILFVALIPMLPSAVQEDALALGDSIPLAITIFGLLLMGFGVTLEVLERYFNEIPKIQRERFFVQTKGLSNQPSSTNL